MTKINSYTLIECLNDVKEDTPDNFSFDSSPLWKDYPYLLISVMECSNLIKECRKDKLLILYHENKELFNNYLH
ncbi:8696_t:CDS:1, partial [Cetraspora pellucida]